MKIKVLILCVSFSVMNLYIFPQGIFDGFMKGKGNLDAALSFNSEMGSGFKSKNGDFSFGRTTYSSSLYLAYGLNNKLDLALSAPYVSVEGKNVSDFQDMQIGLKYNFYNLEISDSKKISIHGAYISSFPLSNYETQAGSAIGQRAVVHTVKLIGQYYFNSNYFVQVQSGFNIAISPVTNSFPFSAKAGWYKDKLYADVWVDYKNAIGGTDYPASDFRTLGNSYVKIGLTGFYRISKKFGAGINSFYTLTGRNTFKGLGLGAALIFKFEK